jgi:hypothetical protein
MFEPQQDSRRASVAEIWEDIMVPRLLDGESAPRVTSCRKKIKQHPQSGIKSCQPTYIHSLHSFHRFEIHTLKHKRYVTSMRKYGKDPTEGRAGAKWESSAQTLELKKFRRMGLPIAIRPTFPPPGRPGADLTVHSKLFQSCSIYCIVFSKCRRSLQGPPNQ